MPSRYSQRIIQHLAHAGYQPSKLQTIAKDMQVGESDLSDFQQAVDQLAEAERLIVGQRDGLLRLPRFGKEITGRLRMNRRGFGFVRPQDMTYFEGDLFIPPNALSDAISGDLVRATVMHSNDRGGRRGSPGARTSGEIVEVLERGQDSFAGELGKDRGDWVVFPDGKKLTDPIIIRDPHAKNAKAGDKVTFEITRYPEGEFLAEGVILEVLGEAGRPDVETQAVIAAHGLRQEFTEALVNEARVAARSFDQEAAPETWPDREDLTDVFTITIDPPDAKDFDDAITIEFDEARQQWTLGVHIADVSHFVKPGGKLDQEAMTRGNSVYLPRLVLPMLPEVLSNGVCSLQEGVHRLAKSAFITYDMKGNVIGERLASTIIKSDKRLTYLEAQSLIDGNVEGAAEHTRSTPVYSAELIEKLALADRLARTLQKRRRRDGMIVLNLPDVDLVFDDDGHVIDAVPEDDAYTHTIIEMFMVEANEAVARTFNSLAIPLLRRVHPDPVHGDMEELRMYARVAHFDLPETPTRMDLQRLLNATRETPASRAIHFAVLRTLTKAEYSPAIIGHFALASDHYAHFTSPIRRYPDLLVHRVVQAYIDVAGNGTVVPKAEGKRNKISRALRPNVPDEGQLLEFGRHCSEMENAAESAERELREFLVLQFLHDNHLGAELPGVVTGVTHRGVFVSIERFLAEGMVQTRDIPQPGGRADRWSVSEQTGRLIASKSGASVGIGDVVTVQLVAIDLAGRSMELAMTKLPVTIPGAGRPPAPSGRRKGSPAGKSGKHHKGKSKAKRGKRRR